MGLFWAFYGQAAVCAVAVLFSLRRPPVACFLSGMAAAYGSLALAALGIHVFWP